MTPSSPRTLAPIAKPATPRKVTSNTSDVFIYYLFDCSFVHSKFVIYSTLYFTHCYCAAVFISFQCFFTVYAVSYL